MKRRLLLFGLLSCAALAVAGEHRPRRRLRTFARPGAERAPRRAAASVSLDEAVSLVRRRVDGRVLAAERRRGEYRVRVLTPDGRVRRFRIDPATGDFR